MGKRRARFRGVKRTSKRLEDEILDKSKQLWEDASLLRPKCAGNCRKCAFDKTFKRISKLNKYKTNADALVKLSGKTDDDIFKAYAATISLYASGTVPYLATAKIGGEEIFFVQRGSVGNDKLIGCQNFDDPKHRLFLYNNFAKKKGLNLYSFEEELVCSNYNNMPEDYIYCSFWETPYEFPNDELMCQHTKEAALLIHIKSADKTIRICKNCVKNISSLQYLISKMVSSDPLSDFEIKIEHNYHSENESGIEEISPEDFLKYSRGILTDSQILNNTLKSKLGELKNVGTSTFVIGDVNYGSNRDDFISALHGSNDEIESLTKYLSEYDDTIVIQTNRASEALSHIWEESYKEILTSFTSEETAEKIGDASKKNPQTILSEARRLEASKDVVKSLPVFKNMGEVTKLADKYAKTAKVGNSTLQEELSKNPPRTYHSRALAKAFAICVLENPTAVKTTAEEEDLAHFLVPFVKDLVDSVGDEYRHKMNTLLSATGCGESV